MYSKEVQAEAKEKKYLIKVSVKIKLIHQDHKDHKEKKNSKRTITGQNTIPYQLKRMQYKLQNLHLEEKDTIIVQTISKDNPRIHLYIGINIIFDKFILFLFYCFYQIYYSLRLFTMILFIEQFQIEAKNISFYNISQRIAKRALTIKINNKNKMNSKLKDHQQFLSQLNSYDSSEFIISSSHSSLKTQSTYQQPQRQQQNAQYKLNDIFSMQHMKEFNQIKQFIQSEHQSQPLLIKSEKNKGKKTLLCQIINHYQKYENKTKLFIPNFSSVNKVYSETLYNIMVKLRLIFDINQKVQVNQEKIRRYFKYWLDITSDKIQKDNLGYSKTQKQTLVIVIDGIDQLTNSKHQKVFPQFWLPQRVPKNVKLILSGTSGQLSIQKLCLQNKVKIINLGAKILSSKLMNKLKPEIKAIMQEKTISLFQIKALQWFLSICPSLKINKKQSFNQIISQYIIQISSKKLSQNQIKSLLLCLTLSKKGLTEQQLRKIMKIKPQALLQFLYMFKPFINCYQSYYMITNPQIKQYIENVYDPMKQKKKIYHQVMAKVIKKQQVSIRKLQQQLHHLLQAENYFQIKQVITEIQNFLVLFTPPCKYLLCNLWRLIQQHLNSDPVFQYNKAVQSFLTHYHPKEQQLFKIIYQISMFFRQYSDFQGPKIPSFRHPLIKGEQQQLQLISVYDQFKHYDMITSLKQVLKKNINYQKFNKSQQKQKVTIKKSDQKQIKLKKSIVNLKKQSISLNKSQKSCLNKVQRYSSSSQTELQKMIDIKDKDIFIQDSQQKSQSIECINLQINLNRQKFRNKYLQILQPYLKQYYAPTKKLYLNDTFVKSTSSTTQMQEDQQLQQKVNILTDGLLKQPLNLMKIKSNMILKNLQEYFQQNYHREDNTKFYYYKEWIWIQFPWICQSLNCNFSDMIQKYIGNATEYMTMEKQINLIKDVLKISKVSKQNKSAIYQNKPIELISIDVKKLRKNKKIASLIRNSVKQDTFKSRMTTVTKNLQQSSMKNSRIQFSGNQNIAKFQLNLTNLDQKLNQQLNKQITHRCVYDSRIAQKRSKLSSINKNTNALIHASQTPFITESSERKQNNQNTKLPYIVSNMKQSRYIKPNTHKTKQLSNLTNYNHQKISINQSSIFDCYDIRTKKCLNQLNNIINQNKQLKIRIQQLQKTSIMLDNVDQQTPYQLNKQKMQHLQEFKNKILKKQEVQQKLKSKLQTIIKICDNNQSHEKQSQILSTFLQNLKIMTSQQQNNSSNLTASILDFVQESKTSIRKLIQTKQSLLNQLKQYGGTKLLNKQSLNDQQMQTSNNLIKNTKQSMIKKHQTSIHRDKSQKVTIMANNDKRNNSKIINNSSKSKTIRLVNKLLTSKSNKIINSGILDKLELIFDYDQQNYEQSVQNFKYLIQQFEEKIVKQKQLNLELQELQYENESLDQEIQKMKQDLKTINEKNETSSKCRGDQHVSQQLVNKRKALQQMRKRSILLQECISEFVVQQYDTEQFNAQERQTEQVC